MSKSKPTRSARGVEVVILAGGASSRLGRDKARARVVGRTLLQHVRAAAEATGWPVRVLRRDVVPKCGPLGGVLTALRAGRGVLVFLSCDMPFVTVRMIRRVATATSPRRLAAFYADGEGRVGFPFALGSQVLPVVEQQVAAGRHSLQELARALDARRLTIPRRDAWRWFNVNTPADLAQARRLAATRVSTPGSTLPRPAR